MLITNVLESPRYRPIFDLAVAGHIQNSPLLIADVTRRLERTASSVHDQVKRLEAEGFIRLEGDARRVKRLVLTEKGLEAADLKPRVPVSWEGVEVPEDFSFGVPAHSAKCGRPKVSDGTLESAAISKLFKGWKSSDRVVFADGDSMYRPFTPEDSISDGDWVWVRPIRWPQNGARLYVEYDTGFEEFEGTVKYFYYDVDTELVTLKAANPDYPDIVRDVRQVRQFELVMGVCHVF